MLTNIQMLSLYRLQHLLSLCELQPGQRVLDLASGTGLVALPAAEAVGPTGFVAAVDISQAMLDQAQSKYEANIRLADEPNCPLHFLQGDIQDLPACLPEERQGWFDVITCSGASPFLQDPVATLKHWKKWLKSGSGRLVFNAFAAPAVEDYRIFVELALKYGLQNESDPFEKLGSIERVTSALQDAGYQKIEVSCEAVLPRW